MPRSKKSINIIGSGMAGLSSAVRLALAGHDIQVFEAADGPGGKLREMQLGDYRFDLGPSLFTMPQYVDALFEVANRDPRDYFNYHRKETVCHYFWSDGTAFQALANTDHFAANASQTFGVSKQSILHYFKDSERKYELTAGLFLEQSLHKASTYLSKETLKAVSSIGRLDLHKSLHEVNQQRFDNKKLVQLFDRYATYNGSDPYRTPGIMSMIPHLEQHYGTYFPKGGMHSITKALHRLALDVGVNFHFNSPVDRILTASGRAIGVRSKGLDHPCDIVVSNMDVVPTYRRLMPHEKSPHKTLSQERSSSALIFYWGIAAEFPELDLHNILFSEDYQREFKAIFEQGTIADEATIYINISSKEEATDAPSGKENWFVMINAPGDQGQDWESIIDRCRAYILQRLSGLLKQDIASLIEVEHVLDPRGIASSTGSHQGSLYGAASNDRMAAFLRHPNFSSRIDALYFCGGSVHPGGGIPLCLLSGAIVADLVSRDRS